MSNQGRLMPEDNPKKDPEHVRGDSAEQPNLKDAVARIDDVLGQTMREGDVFVISGANSQPFPVATRTVREVRRMLQQVMNVGPDAAALVNGRLVSSDHILQQSDVLEFVKEGGEKGGRCF
jgi:sulfur carrier protein ThiS